MLTAAFKIAYAKLNSAQKSAVDAIEGPVMVTAGPGTGKTQVLTLRIANILVKTDTPPEAILALTFTEKAAYEMRERLLKIIGQAAYRVRIRTFHGFCNEIIQSEPDMFPHILGASAITEADKLGILEAILAAGDYPLLKPVGRPEAYVRAISGALDTLKREGATASDLSAMIKSEEDALSELEDFTDEHGNVRAKYRTLSAHIAKQRELVSVYRAYTAYLQKDNRYDFADMVLEVMRILENNKGFRRELQERFLYILVDEYQDTNRAQNRIVQLIGEFHDQPNIFVVGDLAQAIYRFQGASLENFRSFSKTYPKAKIVRLANNYRSTQAILEAAAGIKPGDDKLKAAAGHEEHPISICAFSSPLAQEFAVAHMAQERIRKGTKPSAIAILFRTNVEGASFMQAMEKLDVPCVVESDDDILDDPEIHKLLTLARALKDMAVSSTMEEALYIDFLELPPLDTHKVIAHANTERINVWEVIGSPKIMAKLRLQNAEKFTRLCETMTELARSMRNKSAPQTLGELIQATGFLAHIIGSPDGERVLAKLNALHDMVRAQMESAKGLKLTGFLETLDLMARHNAALRASVTATPENAVRLMTVHKAKGLEFDTVFIVNVAHGHWDGARKPPELKLPAAVWRTTEAVTDELDDNTESDIRNLFYVAVTRARQEVFITYSKHKSDGKEQLPSLFIQDIPEKYRLEADTSQCEGDLVKHQNTRFSVRLKKPPLAEKKYLNELFRQQEFSVTALNNYLQCPWRFFFSNLLRIREASSAPSEYGKAAHTALRSFFENMKSVGRNPGKNYLLSSFSTAVARAPLPNKVIEQLIRDGHESLGGYYDEYRNQWHVNVRTEESIHGVDLNCGKAETIKLTGKLDKLEITSTPLSGPIRVNVVDYKTKQPMSANAICGKTKDATGNEFRQLVFYKLLLDSQNPRRYEMVSGEIDFLEPNNSGKYKKERFVISAERVQELKDQITSVVSEIIDLSFWNKKCDENACRYCAVRNLMK